MVMRQLGIVKEIIEEQGQQLSHVYDDLVFMEHNAFLIQFDKEPNNLNIFFNVDCEPEAAVSIEKGFTESAKARQMKIKIAGKYSLTPKEETEELEIKFFPN